MKRVRVVVALAGALTLTPIPATAATPAFTLSGGVPVKFPLFYDNYFVPRGYAVVLVDFLGTNRSRGCVDVGGQSEIASGTAVIDWLNGRRTGYTTLTGS